MWLNPRRDLPDIGAQVVGILVREDGYDAIAWWTRTDDGWYVSDNRGNMGHRDAMTKEASDGPDWWQHPPRKQT